MTRMFLHIWNVSATFTIWSSGKKNPYLKYFSSHFLTLAIELHMVHFGLGAFFTAELFCYYRPHLHCCYYFQWQLVVKMAGRAAKFHLWLNIQDCRTAPGCL